MTPTQAPPPERTSILLVDDDPSLLRAFARVFGQVWDIQGASSGEEALQLLAQRRFDVAIVDYSMPGMDGVELLRRLADDHPTTARLMLTAYADLPGVVAQRDLGLAAAVLTKPWERADVEKAINRALQLTAMQRAVNQMRRRVDRPG
ncbi:MAG: response regulator [Anaeromyxobacter sp.]